MTAKDEYLARLRNLRNYVSMLIDAVESEDSAKQFIAETSLYWAYTFLTKDPDNAK